jgi:hypothetical protein
MTGSGSDFQAVATGKADVLVTDWGAGASP